jgi:hypothetical protein
VLQSRSNVYSKLLAPCIVDCPLAVGLLRGHKFDRHHESAAPSIPDRLQPGLLERADSIWWRGAPTVFVIWAARPARKTDWLNRWFVHREKSHILSQMRRVDREKD